MAKPSKAVLALESVLASSDTNQPMNEAIGTFVGALKAVDPDRVFTVLDIVAWASEYKRQDPNADLPDELFNTYSLGKYLKARYSELGIISAGTYGNRQVWGLDNG